MTPLFGSVINSGGGSITASSAKASDVDACNYRDAEESDSAGYDHLGAVANVVFRGHKRRLTILRERRLWHLVSHSNIIVNPLTRASAQT
jgi:hypothetical protein